MSQRQQFKGRGAFIFAAVGSAVGLGNIWRFPYVAYKGGGGAFILPYLAAVVTAGIPLLFLLYAIGSKYRSSSPLSFKRLHPKAEVIGWLQVGISFIIAVYYAVVIAWALRYIGFSLTRAWGGDTQSFFVQHFLHQRDGYGFGGGFVAGVAVPLILVWIFTLGILYAGIQKGVARLSQIFIPVLVVIFALLVIQALRLPGAAEGLNALFTPDWSALGNSGVWISAYGQIFFSMSISFGIMITFSAHVKRKTNLTASGLVVAFANSGFELLAGIGVFAALGFMAQSQGQPISEVVKGGVGLAFFAFPKIISAMPGGTLFGVLFFVSLVLAGLTSLVSIIEVVFVAFEDKFGMHRGGSVLIIGILMAVLSVGLFPTTTGLHLLDVIDHFINNFGVVGVGLTITILLAWVLRRLRPMGAHLNEISSFKVGGVWRFMLTFLTPVVLGFMFISELITSLRGGYEGMPHWYVGMFGWGILLVLLIAAAVLTVLPWRKAGQGRQTGARAIDQGESE